MLNTVSSLLQHAQPLAQIAMAKPSQVVPKTPTDAVTAQSGQETDSTASASSTPSTSSTLGNDTFLKYGRTASLVGGSAVAAYRLGEKTGNLIQEVGKSLEQSNGNFQAALPSIKNALGAGLQGAGLSAMVAAGISTVVNGVAASRGEIDKNTAFSNVFADSISGAMAGFGSVSAAGAGSLMMRSLGMAGLPLTIATTVIGVAGGVALGKLSQAMSKPLPEPDLSI